MSEKKDQEYFSDGMAEEIIDLLVKMPDLKVPARTSCFYFKGKAAQVPEIAKALGVAHILEGSVRKAGNRVRVTVQLVRADDGYHLWSETYDRQVADIFKMQDEIAGAELPAGEARYLRDRFRLPTPRLALGEHLRGLASACIDVSDGLLADAGKLAGASGLGCELSYTAVPLSEALLTLVGEERARELAFTGGDDYELCFAVPPQNLARLTARLPPQRWGYTRIGVLDEGAGARVVRDGSVMEFSHSGYEHFA